MDAHVFRRFCALLTEVLPEARLEKIQSPAADVHIFTFYAQQRKQILVLRHDRRNPLLFFSPEAYSTGQHPPASTMRLRKYAAGRRVKAMRVDWPARCLHICFQLAALPFPASTDAALAAPPLPATTDAALAVPPLPATPEAENVTKPDSGPRPQSPQPETWISLDLRHGPVLTLGRSPDVGQEPLWPSPEQVAACLLPAPLSAPLFAKTAVRPHELARPDNAAVAERDMPARATPAAAMPEKDVAENLVADAAVPEKLVLEKAVTDATPQAQPWEQWPVLTPALRRTLAHVDPLEQAALLADLEYGGGDIFVYSSPPHSAEAGGPAQADEGKAAGRASTALECVAWPLPPVLRGPRCEQVYEDPAQALALMGTAQVLGGLARAAQQSAASPHKREAKRLSRVLDKLEREEQRLRAMLAGKDRALYLQSVLWFFAPEARPKDLAHASCPSLPPCPFDPALLQPQLSLRENMEALFHGAARGQRGLTMLHERRALLRGQVQTAESAVEIAHHAPPLAHPVAPVQAKGSQAAQAQRQSAKQGKGVSPTAAAGKATAAGKQAPAPLTVGPRLLPKNVEAFTSVDGLIILRGKDAKGNLALLKLGAPTDLWLHVEGGPGAHTLIRRASIGQEIPQTTLEQAATLAAIKSWQKGNERVGVQCAEVRHIKPMRGAAAGTVRIDKVACMVWVNMPLVSAS